jgi:retron-type reverse transcriptase
MFEHKYEKIIKIENLIATWERFLRGKRRKKDVASFEARLTDNLAGLHQALADKIYEHGPYAAFNVSDPKPRNIHKAAVRDRFLHHLLHKELYPYFEKRYIYDSYSCRLNKGVHRAMDRFKRFAGEVSKNHSRTCYVLKCDIKKFFASIDHTTLIKILKRHIEDKEIVWLINRVISSFYSARPGVGLPLGNLTSQLLVNVYMHEFDMYMKQQLRVKYYIRYADDFIILSDNKDYLDNLLPEISEFLQTQLKLNLHERKVCIKTYASGVDFLGWVHFPYYRQLRTATKRKIIRKLRGYPKRETVISYLGFLGHGNAYKFKKKFGFAE